MPSRRRHRQPVARPRRWAATTAALLLLTLLVPGAAFAQVQDDSASPAAVPAPTVAAQAPEPAVFIVGDDDALEGSGVALRDAIQFAPGDSAARYVAVIGADTDRQINLDATVDGPLVDHGHGVRVTVSGCNLPAVVDPDPAQCSSWTEHYTGRLADLDSIEVGAALADQGRMVRLVLALPEDAPNELQGEQTIATYTITAVDAAYDPQDPQGPPDPSADPPVTSGPGADRLPRTGIAVFAALLTALGLMAAGTVAVTAARQRAGASTSPVGVLVQRQRTWVMVAAIVAVLVGALAVQGAFAQFSGANSAGSINVTTIPEFE